MNQPTLTEERSPDRHDTLWVTDAELIRRSGVPEKIARQAIEVLDKNEVSGFPQKDPMWGNRRYWPAVQLYWSKRQGLIPQEMRKSA